MSIRLQRERMKWWLWRKFRFDKDKTYGNFYYATDLLTNEQAKIVIQNDIDKVIPKRWQSRVVVTVKPTEPPMARWAAPWTITWKYLPNLVTYNATLLAKADPKLVFRRFGEKKD